jgi:hypothetical protein
VAVVVGLILIFSGGDDDDKNVNVATSTPTATVPTTPTAPEAAAPAPATPPAAAPAKPEEKPNQAAQLANCDPIIGSGASNSGTSYPVTSSSTSGAPADCGEARSVLLTALNSGGGTVGQWQCTTDFSGSTIASCTSGGGQKIEASG